MKKSDLVSRELLVRLYLDARKPTEVIGAELGMSGRYVRMLLKAHGIETLDRREEYAENLRKSGAETRFKNGSAAGAQHRFSKGAPGWSKGFTKETHPSVAKIANSKRGKPRLDMRGDKHPFWKGGATTAAMLIRNSKAYGLWRDSVFKRDRFTCADCGQIGGTLHAHHVLSFADHPDRRLDVDNGVTLCVACHSNRHPDKPNLKGVAKSIEHRLSLSESIKRTWSNPALRARQSERMKALMQDPARREHLSKVKMGQIPWNKGLTKETNSSVASTGAKNRAHMLEKAKSSSPKKSEDEPKG